MVHPPALWSLASFTGIGALLFQPDPQFYVLCGIVITSLCGLISSRLAAKDAERRHQWEKEDRERFREGLKTDLKQGIEKLNPPSV